MITIKPMQGEGGDFLNKGLREAEDIATERVVLRRFSGLAGGNEALGMGQVPQYEDIPCRASIDSLSAQEIMAAGGVYEAGDLQAAFKIAINGAEGGVSGSTAPHGDGQTPGRRSDLVLYRGRTYRVVGHPQRLFLNGGHYWRVVLRQGAA